ncbi:hypothetical protein BC939DRAFT_527165 [Gamsiella multidivaricata]|uniref:uncharacterized protein n=1 Tax=Gamsiella multidivaricata TaxID=101098 RepID=UPI0022208694|nr:uncharacterized protein BC939DRAFT_527165 [Gamsiella multidivaricata]KAI7827400.1 hypothetical protein BC939DRAFT_527165 [Gamsiella multidivaricata]
MTALVPRHASITSFKLAGLEIDWASLEELKSLRRLKKMTAVGIHINRRWISLISRCSNLQRLYLKLYDGNATSDNAALQKIALYAAAAAWPQLESIHFAEHRMVDDDLAILLSALKRCHFLDVCGFWPRSSQAFHKHFATIETLNLCKCPTLTSMMVQEILSSSP